jgi:tetratricopeptide (TPR) repeat protein
VSLLLEALKKAEKAKEEAQRRTRDGDPAAAPAPDAKPAATPAIARDKPAEVSPAPLGVAAEEPPAAAPAAPSASRAQPLALELEPASPAPQSRPSAKTATRSTSGKAAETEAAGRASAKKVFEAKFREPNPRMPFYIAVGTLGAFAVGTVVYFWYQLRPPPSLVNLNPPPQAQTAQLQAEPQRAPVFTANPAQAAQSIPGLPSAPPKSAAPAPKPALPGSEALVKAPADAAPVEKPRLAPQPQALRPAAPSSAPERTVVSRTPAQVNPRIEAGYGAYVAGDLAAARTEYEQALRDEPSNRDAMLGLAALDVRSGRYDMAESLYQRVLAADPRNSQAQAALISLRAGRSDPLATESRVKSMLATDPAAHVLNFTLGNQLAQQSRWAEAQQEYFKAYTAEPDNADFAYNLAISLDHLRQSRQALEYYLRAITLGEKRGASFNLDSARSRAAQLAK